MTVVEGIALVFSALAILVSIRAYRVSKRALAINEKEHEWKAAERAREVAREEWCEAQLGKLNGVPREFAVIEVPDEYRPWAKWGDGRFFTARNCPDGTMRLYKLGT